MPNFVLQDGSVLPPMGFSGHCNIPTQQWWLFVPCTAALSLRITRGFLHCGVERSHTFVWFQCLLRFQTESPNLDLCTPLVLWLYCTKGTWSVFSLAHLPNWKEVTSFTFLLSWQSLFQLHSVPLSYKYWSTLKVLLLLTPCECPQSFSQLFYPMMKSKRGFCSFCHEEWIPCFRLGSEHGTLAHWTLQYHN